MIFTVFEVLGQLVVFDGVMLLLQGVPGRAGAAGRDGPPGPRVSSWISLD